MSCNFSVNFARQLLIMVLKPKPAVFFNLFIILFSKPMYG